MNYQEAREAVHTAAQNLYEVAGLRWVKPLHGRVLVWVAPKEQVAHGIILPESQNKLYYEGIVLRTWEPFYRHIRYVHQDGEKVDVQLLMKSEMAVGDHVIFQHWAGYPVATDGQVEKDFRLVAEVDQDYTGGSNNCIAGKVIYERVNVQQELQDLIWEHLAKEYRNEGGVIRDFTVTFSDAILSRFNVLVKSELKHLTLTGV